MRSLIAAAADPSFPAEIVSVISNVECAGGLVHAAEAGIAGKIIPHKPFPSREAFDAAIDAALLDAEVEIVCLAGFMRILSDWFARKWEGRLLNIHPSLLPSFPGLEAWKQALNYGVKTTGCTVHFVDAGVDAGPVIGQQTVPVLDRDTPETLHQRIQVAEHELYPKCVAAIARGGISVAGRRVIWKI